MQPGSFVNHTSEQSQISSDVVCTGKAAVGLFFKQLELACGRDSFMCLDIVGGSVEFHCVLYTNPNVALT